MDPRSRSRSRSRSPSPRSGGREFRGDRFNRDRDDYRVRDRGEHRGGGGGDDRDYQRGGGSRGREKDKDQLERERRERMARMRADNDAEERGEDLTSSSVADGVGGDSSGNGVAGASKQPLPEHNKTSTPIKSNNDGDDEEVDDEQQAMMQMMGIGGFGSTKGKAVEDNQSSAARGAASKNKGRKYRQYMNRKGGFNRPLDKMN